MNADATLETAFMSIIFTTIVPTNSNIAKRGLARQYFIENIV